MPSLAGERAWTVSDQLDPGPYLAARQKVERDTSSNKNPQVKVDWRVSAGPFKGAEQTDWITLTENSLGRVVQVLEACDIPTPEQEFDSYEQMADWLADALRGFNGTVEMVIRHKPGTKNPEVMFADVAGYRKPNPSDIPNDTAPFASAPKLADNDKPPF